MRDYAIISPRFWNGATGREIRRLGVNAQVVALYLMTCPSSNMIGLYYLPITLIAHEVALSFEGASEALQSLSEAGFCTYDHETEMVWVFEMARYQIAESLSPKDNRVKGIQGMLKSCVKTKLLQGFLERYQECFHLENPAQNGSPSEAPSKPGTGTGTDKDILSEATSEKPTDEPIEGEIRLPLKDGTEFVLPKDWLDTLAEAYPDVSIPEQAAQARAWLESNPQKKKTRRGIKRFFNGWLTIAQKDASQKRTRDPTPLPNSGRKSTPADAGPAPWAQNPEAHAAPKPERRTP